LIREKERIKTLIASFKKNEDPIVEKPFVERYEGSVFPVMYKLGEFKNYRKQVGLQRIREGGHRKATAKRLSMSENDMGPPSDEDRLFQRLFADLKKKAELLSASQSPSPRG